MTVHGDCTHTGCAAARQLYRDRQAFAAIIDANYQPHRLSWRDRAALAAVGIGLGVSAFLSLVVAWYVVHGLVWVATRLGGAG